MDTTLVKNDETFSFSKRDCCICSVKHDVNNMLTPRRCLVRNGIEKSHKICQSCWFSIFAVEDAKHNCPGCPVYKKPDPILDIIEIE